MKKGKKNSLEITKFAKIPLFPAAKRKFFEAVACQATKRIRLRGFGDQKVKTWLFRRGFADEKRNFTASRQNAVVGEHLLVHF